MRLLREEYDIRKKYGLPAELLEREALRAATGIDAPGALINRVSAQLDAFRAAAGLLRHDVRRHGLDLYSHTEITAWERTPEGYLLTTADGKRIACRYAIVAAGFEAAPFLRKKPMRLTSTFAIISEPVAEKELWPERSLIWETRSPYLYIRTDNTRRIIVGGEDISSDSPFLRRLLLPRKAAVLERKFRKLFPHIPFKRELAWAGTFSSTRDGLPLIGARHDDPHMLYAAGIPRRQRHHLQRHRSPAADEPHSRQARSAGPHLQSRTAVAAVIARETRRAPGRKTAADRPLTKRKAAPSGAAFTLYDGSRMRAMKRSILLPR